jgi:AcrR family transcriptional regulator
MCKQSETVERTRQNLIDAFWSLYTTRRIEKITVREITTRAGYNRGTFYEYFRDVYDVLEQIEAQALPTFEEFPPMMNAGEISPVFVKSFLSLYREKFKVYDVLLGDNGDPAFQRKLKNSIKSSLLEMLPKKGKVDLIEVDLMLEYILSGLIGILMYAFQNRQNIPEERLVSTIYTLLQGDMSHKLQKLSGLIQSGQSE